MSPNNYVSEADASGNRSYRGSDAGTGQFPGLSACNDQKSTLTLLSLTSQPCVISWASWYSCGYNLAGTFGELDGARYQSRNQIGFFSSLFFSLGNDKRVSAERRTGKLRLSAILFRRCSFLPCPDQRPSREYRILRAVKMSGRGNLKPVLLGS